MISDRKYFALIYFIYFSNIARTYLNHSTKEMRTGSTLDIISHTEPDPACLIRVPRFDRMLAVGLFTNFNHCDDEACIFFFNGFNFLDKRG